MPDVMQNPQAAPETASAPGEPALSQSAPAQPASSGSTDTPAITPSTVAASIPTPTEAVTPPATVETTKPDGTVDEPGNATAGATNAFVNQATNATDASAAGFGEPLRWTQPAPTDSVNGSPTGGPIAGRGDTPEAKAKHGFLDRVRDDLHAELNAIEGLPRYVLHVLEAVFDRHHTHVDNDAAR